MVSTNGRVHQSLGLIRLFGKKEEVRMVDGLEDLPQFHSYIWSGFMLCSVIVGVQSGHRPGLYLHLFCFFVFWEPIRPILVV